MEVVFTEAARKDLEYWKETNNVKVQKRITALLQSIMETPFTGIGKPEPLRYDLAGYWSRRITDEHRLVYSVSENIVTVIAARFHY
ncbi:Txe/YoeB family addiction module toxin [Chitinophaga sp. CC14]|uniref:Txe/YoeB family addiction module toxin n=1 Tax=Chitinophaga sp. CC14 TaxID=3029199 RepID=UPI003B7B1B3D